MGLVDESASSKGLRGALKFLREYVGKIVNKTVMSLEESYMVIIVLGLYLYSKYYKCGTIQPNGHEYFIVAKVVKRLYINYDTDLADFVSNIIITRNEAVHETWNINTNDDIKDILDNDLLIRLLRCEGIVDKDLNFVEPKGGKYTPVSGPEEAHELIKSVVDKINTEDKEKEEKSASILHAVSTMGN